MRARRALLLVAVVVTVLVLPTATTAAPDLAPAKPAKLVVVDQGFSILAGSQSVLWAAVVKNASKDVMARYVTVTATITDAAGTVVYEGNAQIDTILPGTRSAAATGGPTTGPGASKLEIGVDAEYDVPLTGRPGTIKATGLEVDRVENGERTRFRGTMISNLRVPVEEPETVLVFRDARGKVLGGLQSYQGATVPRRGRAPFKVETYLPLPAYDAIDVYVIIPSLVNKPVR